jgi:hypothetical protein
MRFPYLQDPLFLFSLVLYAVNRWWIKPHVAHGFFHAHLNDLICIPFLVPPMLFAARRLGLRRHDRPPLAHEIFLPLVIWSILFEIIFPQDVYWSRWTTGDHRDVLFYALGATGATAFWTIWYRTESASRRDGCAGGA